MTLILIIIILLLVFGGGGSYYGRRANWGPRGYAGGLIGLLILILLVGFLVTTLETPPIPRGTPPISRTP